MVTAEIEQAENLGECPKCGSTLVRRINSNTKQEFLGCSTFPKCKGSQSVSTHCRGPILYWEDDPHWDVDDNESYVHEDWGDPW